MLVWKMCLCFLMSVEGWGGLGVAVSAALLGEPFAPVPFGLEHVASMVSDAATRTHPCPSSNESSHWLDLGLSDPSSI